MLSFFRAAIAPPVFAPSIARLIFVLRFCSGDLQVAILLALATAFCLSQAGFIPLFIVSRSFPSFRLRVSTLTNGMIVNLVQNSQVFSSVELFRYLPKNKDLISQVIVKLKVDFLPEIP